MWYLDPLVLLLFFLSSTSFLLCSQQATALSSSPSPTPKQGSPRRKNYDYDLIIIGAGASGMFASGTSSSFGCRTLLIEKMPLSDDGSNNESDKDADLNSAIASKGLFVGGDCTNAACVPSKAMRSISNIAAIKASSLQHQGQQQSHNQQRNMDWFHIARNHSKQTVEKVRSRESVKRLASVPNLDLVFVSNVSFVSPHDVQLHQPFWCRDCEDDNSHNEQQQQEEITIFSSKKFLITTGANPIQPLSILNAAKRIELPVLTYRSLFRPDGEGKMSDQKMWNILSSTMNEGKTQTNSTTTKTKNIVIAGGGPVGCEVAQILSRLAHVSSLSNNNKTDISITIVAPTILSSEDVSVRYATREMLKNDGVSIISNKRVVDVSDEDAENGEGKEKYVVLTDENSKSNTTMPVDVLILAMGREPGTNLEQLNLQNAGVKWTDHDGISVRSDLRSVSAKHVYAAGDCASVIQNRDRRAVHAGWTGYHAVQSAFFPRLLKPRSTVHPFVPRVIYTNPEIASIGKSYVECVREFGPDGFRSMREYELDTDRADTDSLERDTTVGFVELRVSHLHGRILGATIVSPSASELINEVGVALVHGMSCRNIARCLHSYPSHGYLMYRVSLALALSDVWGLLAACGPLGRVASAMGGTASYLLRRRGRKQRWWWHSSQRKIRDWEVKGANIEFIDLLRVKAMVNDIAAFTQQEQEQEQNLPGLSFIEVSKDARFCIAARKFVEQSNTGDQNSITGTSSLFAFVQWLQEKPM